jgi:hypothetical protein
MGYWISFISAILANFMYSQYMTGSLWRTFLSMLYEKEAVDLQEAFIDDGFVPAKKEPLLVLPSVEY